MRKIFPFAASLLLLAACQASPPKAAAIPWVAVPATEASWTYVDFGSNGGIELDKDDVVIHRGERPEGLKSAGRVADLLGESLDRYEIKLEVQRTDGHDIFLGLTFPVGAKESASLILGGWGGSLCGISSVDDADASGNAWK